MKNFIAVEREDGNLRQTDVYEVVENIPLFIASGIVHKKDYHGATTEALEILRSRKVITIPEYQGHTPCGVYALRDPIPKNKKELS